ncbi:MAG: hypothetical protein WC307_05830 [Candidatus Nanoarchaeia archaeon]|jgi:hypothetical protein
MWGKPFVSHVENEFKTDKMRNNHVFHDVNLRVNNPEEFRLTCIDYLRSLDFIVDVNEMTEFEEGTDFEHFFRAGRLKPLKNVIKARRLNNVGSRFPFAWKLLFLTGMISIISYLMPFEQLNKELLFYTTTISFIMAGLLYLVKRVITSSVWVKIIGVYDVNDNKADLRLIISADTSDSNMRVFDDLRDDIAEFYDLITRKYTREDKDKELIIKPAAKGKTEELLEKIIKVNNDMKTLNDKFINGRISEDVFKKLSSSLDKEKDKLETVLDLVSL